ncbi:MAG: glutamine-hydrolyzing carbamoyl-phosphate synthase small subunit [DPANN group archaeon]|nr:glutamine-hydrolyzing carbamoyl-phosphate synthase small subunit [DPANN group archaeon]
MERPLPGRLVLENGMIFEGVSFGHPKSAAGEVVFNTGMVGYPQSLTDPSYRGQILTFTYPLIGNYGVPGDELDEFSLEKHFESSGIHVQGMIIDDYTERPSHWTAKKTLGAWLKEQEIPGLYGIDTRALTKTLREKGVMLGKIIIDREAGFDDPNRRDLVKEVSPDRIRTYAQKGSRMTVVVVDCGCKNNIIRELLKRGVNVIRVPYDYDFTGLTYDGALISNGPGDPKKCVKTIEHIRKAMAQEKPLFGICLGNQLTALAAGGNTYKLKYGHRSQNQPAYLVGTRRCFITAQNHGFAVDDKTLPEGWDPWFRNLNDNTNEGIRHRTRPFFTVQFHPEAMAGPNDTNFLFDDFIKIIEEHR